LAALEIEMRALMIATIMAVTLGFAAPAAAYDYTLNVPVRIEGMNHVNSAMVICSIQNRSGVSPRNLADPVLVTVPLRDGNFTGNVSVGINIASGYTRADATHWSCNLSYRWLMPDGTVFNRSLTSGTRASEYTRYTGQAVVSFVESVEGTIPR
jgi:hypothetical protein